jgi:hypothetical protein
MESFVWCGQAMKNFPLCPHQTKDFINSVIPLAVMGAVDFFVRVSGNDHFSKTMRVVFTTDLEFFHGYL